MHYDRGDWKHKTLFAGFIGPFRFCRLFPCPLYHVLSISLLPRPARGSQVFTTPALDMGTRPENFLGRRHSQSHSVLYSSLSRKSISKTTSWPSGLPNHWESPRDEGGRTVAQVFRVAKQIRSVRYRSPFFQYLNLSLPGDVIYLNAAGQPIVIINSSKVAVELLDRRAAIYSDRPRNIVVSDIMCGGLLFGFSRYGDT